MRIFNEVSHEMGFECPEYKSVRSQIIRNINKQLLPDIKTFEEIPDESIYFSSDCYWFDDISGGDVGYLLTSPPEIFTGTRESGNRNIWCISWY